MRMSRVSILIAMSMSLPFFFVMLMIVAGMVAMLVSMATMRGQFGSAIRLSDFFGRCSVAGQRRAERPYPFFQRLLRDRRALVLDTNSPRRRYFRFQHT